MHMLIACYKFMMKVYLGHLWEWELSTMVPLDCLNLPLEKDLFGERFLDVF